MSRARKIEPASGIERWVPGLAVARRYQRSWLRGDLVAGLVLAALLVPQGMAYAKLAGLPAVYGLYATMVPLIVYAVLGPSRILVLGPDSAVAPVVAAAIIPIAGNDTGERVALAGLLAVLVGVACIAGGIAGFGFLTDLISKPIRIGYLAGIAVSVNRPRSPESGFGTVNWGNPPGIAPTVSTARSSTRTRALLTTTATSAPGIRESMRRTTSMNTSAPPPRRRDCVSV
jgi:hypothetical protein